MCWQKLCHATCLLHPPTGSTCTLHSPPFTIASFLYLLMQRNICQDHGWHVPGRCGKHLSLCTCTTAVPRWPFVTAARTNAPRGPAHAGHEHRVCSRHTPESIACLQLAVPLKPAMEGVSAYTAPGETLSPPVDDAVSLGKGIFEPTVEERAVLTQIEAYTLKTVLFRADPFPAPSPVYPGEVWAGPLDAYDGHVRYLTNSDLSVNGTESEKKTGYVTYQALDQPPNQANNAIMQRLFKEDTAKIGLKNIEVIEEKVWPSCV
jgi:hypothetical protein